MRETYLLFVPSKFVVSLIFDLKTNEHKIRDKAKRYFQTLITIIIFVVCLILYFPYYDVFAEPTSFGRVIITDGEFDTNVDIVKHLQNDATLLDDLPVDILSANYFSDGKTLNATIWLSDMINSSRHDDYFRGNLAYTMRIYSEDMYENTHNITIYPNEDGTWTKVVREYEPDLMVWEGSMYQTQRLTHKDVRYRFQLHRVLSRW